MIEKNFEIKPISEIREGCPDEGKFFDCLERETKKKSGHGEDITVTIFTAHSELFKKKKPASGEENTLMIKGLGRENRFFSLPDTHSRIKKHDALLLNATAEKAAKVSHTAVAAESKSIPTAYESRQAQVVPLHQLDDNISAIGLSARVWSKQDEEGSEKASTDPLKLHTTLLNTKSDLASQHQKTAQSEMPPRSPHTSVAERRLQVNSSEENGVGIRQKQSLNIDFPFVRWSGEHSVKVSIPPEQHRVSNLILQPSDIRAAEILSRQASQLSGYNTQLLSPYKEEDESEQRKTRQVYEEDLE